MPRETKGASFLWPDPAIFKQNFKLLSWIFRSETVASNDQDFLINPSYLFNILSLNKADFSGYHDASNPQTIHIRDGRNKT